MPIVAMSTVLAASAFAGAAVGATIANARSAFRLSSR
jgi:hypothetical protein